MSSPSRIVVFSHGFGVRFDDRGLLTDVRDALGQDSIPYLFDYNQIDETAHTLTVPPLTVQVAKLQSVIKQARDAHPGLPLSLICHSQGCLIVAMAEPQNITKTLFLAPTVAHGTNHLKNLFAGRPNTTINPEGISRIARRDGTTTIVGPDFWRERDAVDPAALYNHLAGTTRLVIIQASEDEVLGREGYTRLDPLIRIHPITADHNFTGAARSHLLEVVKQEGF